MVRISAIFFVVILYTACLSQTIAIKGKISNSNGKAIAGATVTLSKGNITVTSDSKGEYSIVSETATLMHETISPESDMISLRNNSIIVDLAKATDVKIEIFDMQGNLLRKMIDKPATAGSFRFDLASQTINSAMTIVRVSAGAAFSSFRFIPLKNNMQLVTAPSYISSTSEKLAKVKAVIDSLQVKASGYLLKSVPVSSYETTVDVSLDTMALPRFSFFVTSLEAIQDLSKSVDGFGGDLRFGKTGQGAGLLGADSICECIAERSMPGSKVKQWRAFLSVSKGPDGNQVNAIDRIGSGPWYDRMERVIALTREDLLHARPEGCDEEIINDLPNEYGIPNHRPDPNKDEDDNHLTITGSDSLGRLYSSDATCSDWTSTAASGSEPRAGLSWPRAGFGWGFTKKTFSFQDMNNDNWISSYSLPGCEAGIELEEKGAPLPGETFIGAGGGYGGFYCFALNP